MAWYRNNKAAVAEALRRGKAPDLATTMASGPLDELVALHQELGMFAILDELEVQRERTSVPDDLLLRTLATLPFVEQASLSGASEVLFRQADRAAATGLGAGADPYREAQWTASPSGRTARGVVAVSSRYAA